METIKIRFYGNVMYITYANSYQGNVNTCRMTEYNEFFFSKEYLEKHLNTLQFYITPIIVKNQVTKVIVSHNPLLPYIEKIINLYPTIHELYIEQDKEITISEAQVIMAMKFVNDVNCYDIEENIYYKLLNEYHKNVNTRVEILFESIFMVHNQINTYSKLYQKKQVYINNEFNEIDKQEFSYFLAHNRLLEKIMINRYSESTMKYIISTVKQRNILISILNDEQLTEQNYKYLRSLKKHSKIQLELSYSKQYQHKNALKQLNLNLLRFCMILVVFVCVGFASAEHFIFEKDKQEIESIDLTKYEDIVEEPEIEENTLENIEDPEQIETPTTTYVSPYYQTYTQTFTELKGINPDTIGWIKVNNTNVNYPVVKTTDNEYYLNHSFDRTENTFGWIYADYRSNFDELNQNTIIYGHNVLGTNLLLSTLETVVNPDWYNNPNNLTITFNTEKENMKWQVFSIYTIPVTNDYLITNFNSPDSFLNFAQKLKDRSIKDFGVTINGTDKILTISTCYKDSSSRVVIHAKRI